MAGGLTNHSNSSSASVDSALNGHGRSAPGAGINPILVLEPINDNFPLKSLEIPENTRVKIGRQTSVATAPSPSNGYFDSKVLSRVHAEVWAENGKVYIRDVKSSNGTFLNGKRLCPENTESEPFVLNQNDHLEFGIDIMDEGGSLLHEKVACKIYISRMSYPTPGGSPQESHAKLKSSSPSGSGSNSVKSTVGGQSTNIDLIISRLQNELTRSQETNADLGALKQGLGELERNIIVANKEEGNVKGSDSQQTSLAVDYQKLIEENSQAHAIEISKMNRALEETQSELEAYVQKVQLLEPLVAEDEILRRDIAQNTAELTKVKLERDLAKDTMNELINEHQQVMDCLRKEHEAALSVLEEAHKENLECVAREARLAQELLTLNHQEELSKALESTAVTKVAVTKAEEAMTLQAELTTLRIEVGAFQESAAKHGKTIHTLSEEKTVLVEEKTVLTKELSETKAKEAEIKAILTKTEGELREAKKLLQEAKDDLSVLTPTTPSRHTAAVAASVAAAAAATTVLCKNPDCQSATDKKISSSRKEVITRQEFSWAQYVFPAGSKDLVLTRHPTSTMVMSSGAMLVGIGAYVLWKGRLGSN